MYKDVPMFKYICVPEIIDVYIYVYACVYKDGDIYIYTHVHIIYIL